MSIDENGTLEEDYPDGAYILYKPYLEPPNMDIVVPQLYDDGTLYGYKSVVTGLALTAWPDEDQLFLIPKDGFKLPVEFNL